MRLDRGRWGVVAIVAGIALGAGHAVADDDPPQRPRATAPAVPASPASAPTASAAERARSRTAHADLSGSSAVALAQETFPGATKSDVFSSLAPGDRLVRRLDRHTAIVRHRDGSRGLLRSTDDVTVGAVPVDLSLTADAGAFRPRVSATALRIGAQLGDGVTLGADDPVRLELAGAETTRGILREDRVYWPEVAKDSDFFVTPIPGGVETFVQLRSAASPERYTIALDLPAGATTRRAISSKPIPNDPPEAYEIVLDGETLGYVYPPLTADAEGRVVPTTFSVDESAITLDVDHQGRDLTYPLLLDPAVIRQGAWGGDWQQWEGVHNVSNPTSSHHIGMATNDPAYAQGLYLSLPTNNRYSGGEAGWFRHWVPNGVNVYRVDFGNIAHHPQPWSRTWHGIQNAAGTAWAQPVNYNNQYGQYGGNPFIGTHAYSGFTHTFCFYEPRCGRYADEDRNWAVWGLNATRAVSDTNGNKAWASMGWANVYYGDRWAPSVSASSLPSSAWRTGVGTQTRTFPASDWGTGLSSATLSGALSGGGTQSTGCNGGVNVAVPCAPNVNFTWSYALREGLTTLGVGVVDVIGNGSAPVVWTERIDRQPPQAPTLGGSLWTGRNAPVTDGNGTLTVSASDTPGQTAAAHNSGISSVTVRWDRTDVVTRTASCNGTDNCSTSQSFTFAELTGGAASRAADGDHYVEVIVRDRLGQARSSGEWVVTVDRDAPTATHDAQFRAEWRLPAGSVSVTAQDAGSGVRTVTVDAGGNSVARNASCTGPTRAPCPRSFSTGAISYTLPDGLRPLTVTATDAVNRTWTGTWFQRADGTAPSIYFGATDDDPVVVGESLGIHVVEYLSESDPRAGVKSVTITVEGQSPQTTTLTCTPRYSTVEPQGYLEQCPGRFDTVVTVPPTWTEGMRSVTVTARDYLGNERTVTRSFYTVVPPAVDRAKLGLERFFGYESFETGAGSAAHVNVANRNMVWHQIPISNPGRGLSTVVNLTYNSMDRGGYLGSLIRGDGTPIVGSTVRGLAGIAYGEAGMGFSLGISSLTRLNEPLTGVGLDDLGEEIVSPPTISLTDADGTTHTFQRDDSRPGWYREPAGVNIALRRNSESDAQRRWAATRPDGVVFFFDSDGYQTYVRDRNGNELRFEYERYSKATGRVEDCQVPEPALNLLCSPRVIRVVDAAGVAAEPAVPPAGSPRHPVADRRSLKIEYYPNPVLPLGPGSGPISRGLIGPVGGTPGRIKRIVDHAGRATDFIYDAAGYLTTLAQGEIVAGPGRPASTAYRRTFRLEYSGSGQNRQLWRIVDPRGNATELTYEPSGGTTTTGLPLTELRTRRGGGWTFTPVSGRLRVTAPGPRSMFHTVDGVGRPTELETGRPIVHRYGWDADNNLSRLERGREWGSAGVVTTTMFDRHGNPRSVTDPRGNTTTFAYRYGTEGGTTLPEDDGLQYVTDLVRIDRPGENDLALGVDERGNIVSQQSSGYQASTAQYDAHGQLVLETDEIGQQTRFQEHDESGLPQLMIDARLGHWKYRYDAVGNTLTATDPRGATPSTGEPFTTSLTYDAFDRVVTEQHPKDTDRETGRVWITRQRTYDANGNPDLLIDGNGRVSRWFYTPTDRLQEVQSPATAHAGSSELTSEITRYEYDLRENVVKVVAPEGTRTATADDFTTHYRYDGNDRVDMERRTSRGATTADLVTTYRYDGRDNLVRVADPRTNAAGTLEMNVDYVPRWRFTYDAADNRVDAIETSYPSGAKRHTRYVYDANNRVQEILRPRGMSSGGEPNSDAALFSTTYTYDSRDQVTSETHGGDRTTRYVRRQDGKVRSIVDPKGADSPNLYRTTFNYAPTGEVDGITLPTAEDDYIDRKRISYTLNAVGDPVQISDPRGNGVQNTFYDTGHLRSTTRPGLWRFAPGADRELQELPFEQWRRFTTAKGQLPDLGMAGDFGRVARQAMPGIPATAAGHTAFNYDGEMRLTVSTDAAGNPTVLGRDALGRVSSITRRIDAGRDAVETFAHDHNGNLRQITDPLGAVTTISYDQFDRWVSRVEPGTARFLANVDSPGTYAPHVSSATWDENGNQLTQTDGENHVTQSTYDGFDQLESVTDPAGGVTTFAYDAHGNMTCKRRPRGNTSTSRGCAFGPFATAYFHNRHDEVIRVDRQADDGPLLQTYFSHDLHGNVIHTNAPGTEDAADRRITDRTFDAHDRLWETTRGVDEGDDEGEDPLTQVREYDPNGNLRRIVNPRGLDGSGDPSEPDDGLGGPTVAATTHATVYQVDADNLLTNVWQPTSGPGDKRYRQHFERDERGRVKWIDAPYDQNADRTVRVSYVYNSIGWVTRSSDEHWVSPSSEERETDFSAEYEYDLAGGQTIWRLSKPSGAIFRVNTREYYPSGLLKRRTADHRQDNRPDRSYVYTHNGNRQPREMADEQNPDRAWGFAYDAVGRMTVVNERWTNGKDTVFEYDADSNIAARHTDGRITGDYVGGKTTRFTYDSLGRETRMTVERDDEDAPRVTQTAYWPSGERRRRTKPNDTIDRWFFDGKGRLARREREPDPDVVRTQGYEYDTNGNRRLDERGTHLYNARDQLVQWTPDSGLSRVVRYTHNGSGALLSKVVDYDGTTPDVTYTHTARGYRLLRVTGSSGGASETLHYLYDVAGNMTCSGSTDADSCVGGTRAQFDDFNRLVGSRGRGTNDDDVTYSYDGLDRRDFKCVDGSAIDCSDGTRREYGYVGTSNQVSLERDGGGVLRTYDYDSSMERVGYRRDKDGDNYYRVYTHDGNGSVIGLESPSGEVSCGTTYAYDPYGESVGTACADEDAQENPFRFEGFHFDAQAGTYDMHAREYRPDVGRFLSLDMFESGAGDLALQADPLTQDRYAFAGGNPVNNVEFDGHKRIDCKFCDATGNVPEDKRDDERRHQQHVVQTTQPGYERWWASDEYQQGMAESRQRATPEGRSALAMEQYFSTWDHGKPLGDKTGCAAHPEKYICAGENVYRPAGWAVAFDRCAHGFAEGFFGADVFDDSTGACKTGGNIAGVASVAKASVTVTIKAGPHVVRGAREVPRLASDAADLARSGVSALRQRVAPKTVDETAPKIGSRGGPGTGSRHIPADVKRREIEASQGVCRVCRQPVEEGSGSPLSREFDHAWPYSRGGDTTFENIQSLCRTCNRRKGSRTTTEFLDWLIWRRR